MAKVVELEKVICQRCGTEYIHKSYRKDSESMCPVCRRRSDKCNVGRVARLKSTTLKECENPNCDDGLGRPFLFYVSGNKQRYCSEECNREVDRERQAERTKQWRKDNPERSKAIEKRYLDKKRDEKVEEEKKFYKDEFWKNFMKGDKKEMIDFEEYKGNKMIVLKRDENDEYPFKFGVRKAQLIVENLEDIKKFVEENGTDE